MLIRDQNGEERGEMAGWFIQHLLLLLRTAFAPVPGAAITSRDRHAAGKPSRGSSIPASDQ
jgi:hypothetical protein